MWRLDEDSRSPCPVRPRSQPPPHSAGSGPSLPHRSAPLENNDIGSDIVQHFPFTAFAKVPVAGKTVIHGVVGLLDASGLAVALEGMDRLARFPEDRLGLFLERLNPAAENRRCPRMEAGNVAGTLAAHPARRRNTALRRLHPMLLPGQADSAAHFLLMEDPEILSVGPVGTGRFEQAR